MTIPNQMNHPRANPVRPGWRRLPDATLPAPTYWPAVLALGTLGLAWGLVTSVLVCGAGLVLVVVSLTGWIRDLGDGR